MTGNDAELLESIFKALKKRAARQLQKETGLKYTKCLRYVDEISSLDHVHFLHVYGLLKEQDGKVIQRLRCDVCGGNTFEIELPSQENQTL